MELKEAHTDSEGTKFLSPSSTKKPEPIKCYHSKHLYNCCLASGIFGIIFLVLGVVVLVVGKPILEQKIMQSMALTPGSERTNAWLNPPVTPHLEAYAFHLTNPDEVLQGKKPIVVEKGPFVYKSVTIKDSDDNMVWNEEDGTLTYRPRKIYAYVPELSGDDHPDTTYLTVPNIPFWTGMNKARSSQGFAHSVAMSLIKSNGGIQPFVNVTLTGLLWGYAGSSLPCLSLPTPKGCSVGGQDHFDDDPSSEWDDEDFGQPKASDSEAEGTSSDGNGFQPPKDSVWEPHVKSKSAYVNCQCEWGLFRDRNVTMRQPIRFFTGTTDMKKKGLVTKYDQKSVLNWWQEGSQCDAVKGQDGSTFPPGITHDDQLEIFIDLMCRTIKLNYEKDTEYAGIRTLRFIPPENALGAHDDPNEQRRNPDNECYCMKKEKFTCFKSGVLNMAPCKRDTNPPLALSMPHFYQADPSYLEAVEGLRPDKEKHQFYLDVVPEFGFPLAIRPRFQLNLVLFPMQEVKELANIAGDIVLPFMWAQDGFSQPSEAMVKAIAFGISAPDKVPMLAAILCFVLGAMLMLACLIFFVWKRRNSQSQNIVPHS